MTWHECVRAELAAQRVTQRELARRIGRPYRSVSGWLVGDHQPPVAVVTDVAEALGIVFIVGPDGWRCM